MKIPTTLKKADLLQAQKDALAPEGIHAAALASFKVSVKTSGTYLVTVYKLTGTDHTVRLQTILEPAKDRNDLRSLCVDQSLLLLSSIEAALGVEEVTDLPAALEQMRGAVVQITIRHHTGTDGRLRAEIIGFESDAPNFFGEGDQ